MAADIANTGLIGAVIGLFTFATGLIIGNRKKASSDDLAMIKNDREKSWNDHRLECPANSNLLTQSQHDRDCDRRLYSINQTFVELKTELRDGMKKQERGFERLHERLDEIKTDRKSDSITIGDVYALIQSLKKTG